MRFAILEGGRVVNVAEAAGPLDDNWVGSNSASIGDEYHNGEFSAPAIGAAQLAARRYVAEISGTTVQGLPIDTGRDSQGLIAGAALAALLDDAYVVRWKTAAGFVELSKTQILGVASAVRAHVQACFDREADLLEMLEAGELTAADLEEGWPGEPIPEPAAG